jgi:hypothetical protein
VDKFYIEQIKTLYTAYVTGGTPASDAEDVSPVQINNVLLDVLSNVNFTK